MSLADYFPDKERKSFAERNIDVGNASLVHIPGFNIRYDKFVILVSKCSKNIQVAGVVINSEININVNHNQYLQNQHVLIDCKRHSFLEKDSYINCTDFQEFEIQKVTNYILQNPEKVLGNIEEDIMKKIYSTLTFSRTLSKKLKIKYGLNITS